MSDRILLRGVRLSTHVGVPDDERASAQEVIVDLDMLTDIRAAAERDDFTLTADYAAVRGTLARVALERPRRLIETLAEEMAAAVLREYAVSGVRVVLKKPAALRHEQVDYPGVEIFRGRRNG